MNCQADKISIIIPIYKVEAFLRKCIESVINQTYRYLEIILVDDGSPDGCPEICDEYAAKDHRVKVVHKENGGISSARNAGIELASGEYIGFVDGDDWVELDMYETLCKRAISHKADITICGYYVVKNSKVSCPYVVGEDIVYTREEALKELIKDDKVRNYPWDKLYRRALFAEVRYPLGMVAYEDMATAYKLFALSERIALINEPKYYYLFREEGLSKQTTFKHRYDLFKAQNNLYHDLKIILPECRNVIFERLILFAFSAYNQGLETQLTGDEKRKWDEIYHFIRASASKDSSWETNSALHRIGVKLINKHRMIYHFLYFVYKRFRRAYHHWRKKSNTIRKEEKVNS
jgi:glycosyltransferase involved in cell wall biosynthesis